MPWLKSIIIISDFGTQLSISHLREAVIRAGIININDHPDRLIMIEDLAAAILHTEMPPQVTDIKSGENVLIVI
jgi:hypothetical protein